MPSLPEQLAALSRRVAALAQARAAAEPDARVRLAEPLASPGIPAAVAEILAAAGGEEFPGGAQPRQPWAPNLDAFQRQVSACQRCALGPKRRKLVFGEGSSRAPLVFVGDAPGPEEDAGGRPFAGAAGELLDRMIAAMGYKRADVYLTNLLKCRVAAGREAEAAELEACRPYFVQQLALLKPKAVISLGAIAARALLGGDKPLAELRGRWAEQQGLPLMPTYHPRDLLQDPGLKRHVWDDLKQVMKRLNA